MAPDQLPPTNAQCAAIRQQMVQDQLADRGICDRRVLAAMSQTRREVFVPAERRVAAYDDAALPLRLGQTISQPFTVAFMCQALQLTGAEKVLDVGTGSGYAAAILSQLAAQIISVERLPKLAHQAETLLTSLGYENVEVHIGDGSQGWPAEAPFDAIVAAAAAERLPMALVDQLADAGRLVLPIGKHGKPQRLMRYTRSGEELKEEDLGAFSFVPLICDE